MDLIDDQSECDAAFRFWADTLIEHTTPTKGGWTIEGKGVYFTNYGHGSPGEITREVMLGVDPVTRSSTVKIVRPNGSKHDKGPVTVLAINKAGRKHLLREGRLQRNRISGFIKDNFIELSQLSEVPLFIYGKRSDRQWFVVADLDAEPKQIVSQTAEFSIACARARTLSGHGDLSTNDEEDDTHRPNYGLDEKGRITTKMLPGGSVEVRELQGYVHEALKKIVGDIFKKPKGAGYCVDGMIEPANLLIEIKTGSSAQCIYEGVGQLKLYPILVGIRSNPELALLIPDGRPLKPQMTVALSAAHISVFTYVIDENRGKIRVTFSKEFIERCRAVAA